MQDVSSFGEGVPTFLVNTAQSEITGQGTCNRFFGSFTIKGQSLQFKPFGSTNMMCPDQEKETAFFINMDQVRLFRCEGQKLELLNSEGKVLLEAVRK